VVHRTVRVGIHGVGLIGGSLGLALRRHRGEGVRYRVVGIGRAAVRLRKARALGAVDEFTTGPSRVLPSVDILVLAMGVDLIPRFAGRAAPYLRDGAIITDVGSVKQGIIAGVYSAVRAVGRKVSFVPGHPIAGTEQSGVDHADPLLFVNAPCVLVRTREAAPRAFAAVARMWRHAGARVVEMTAREHDALLALTSHLPHVLSMALLAAAGARHNPRALSRVIAGSFRDMTRVSHSDPALWDAICRGNRQELSRAIAAFAAILDIVKQRLDRQQSLKPLFERARFYRNSCIRATPHKTS